ncbi:MAG: alanyl-tRNA editing protein [Azospirillaceae bacterium]
MSLYREDPYRRACDTTVTAVVDGGVLLDDTVFYPTGGGQPGDSGRLSWPDGTVEIVEAVKHGDGVLHRLAEGGAVPPVGTEVTAEIDWERRYRHMRMHTAMHLLCSLVEGEVTGGQVGAEKSRLDFNVPSATLDKDALTDALNALIGRDLPVEEQWISDADLAERPELVRTMSVAPPVGQGRVRLLRIGPPDAIVDLQPCGGTHVARTGEIGRLRVAKIENKGRQNRRVNIVFDSTD